MKELVRRVNEAADALPDWGERAKQPGRLRRLLALPGRAARGTLQHWLGSRPVPSR